MKKLYCCTLEKYVDQNTEQYCEDVAEDCYACKRAKLAHERKLANSKGQVLPMYIVAFGISKHYGGREEGGWWYDWTSINEVRRAYTLKEALRHAHELKEAYPAPRFNRHSSANNGEADSYIAVCYSEADPAWPEETTCRPHYE